MQRVSVIRLFLQQCQGECSAECLASAHWVHIHSVRAYLYTEPNFIGVRNKCDDSYDVRYHSQCPRNVQDSMTKSNVPDRGKRSYSL